MRKQKAAEKDFVIESLPHNRKEQFFDILKVRFKLIFILGLLLFIGIVPTILTMLFREINVSAIVSNYVDETDPVKLAECAKLVGTSNNLYNLILLPSFLILGIVLSGIFRVLRQLSLGKGIHLGEELKTGIKQNIWHILLIMLVLWILYYLTMLICNSRIDMKIGQYITLGFYIVLIIPISLIAISIITMYNMKFKDRFFACFLFYFKGFFKYVLVIIALGLPLFLFLIPNYLIAYSIFSLFFVIYYPIVLLGVNQISFSYFDTYINKQQYPDFYRKGLF
ncbi:MAG: hypothetical protein HUJ61_02805 [Bacilli bacterium]|nr:hypothetical protein [Bacilli bacterium]